MATIHLDKLAEIKKDYQDGFSVREIAEKFNISLKAAFYFFRKNKISRRKASKSNQILFARKKFKIAGLMLYWGEGAKRGKMVDLANSDAEIIKIFLNFLRNICGVDEKRLRVYTYCHSNQDTKSILGYWSKITGISAGQFIKPYIKIGSLMKVGRQMTNGMIHIRYNDKKLLNYILQEIDKCKEQLV